MTPFKASSRGKKKEYFKGVETTVLNIQCNYMIIFQRVRFGWDVKKEPSFCTHISQGGRGTKVHVY